MAFLKGSIFSFLILNPIAIGCPPYFSRYSEHANTASTMENPSTLLPEPLHISPLSDMTIDGFPKSSVTLDETIPITPAFQFSEDTTITLS